MAELDLRLLRYFVTLAETGSFTDAARQLHVAQPTLSQGIARLERLVGIPLIDRGPRGSTRGVLLTDGGRSLLPEASDILVRVEGALRRTRRLARREAVRIGFGANTPRDVIGTALALGEQSGIQLTLEHVPWGQELHQLRSGLVDACFLQVPAGFEDADLRFTTLRRVGRVAVFRRGHPLGERTQLGIAELADEPIIDAASDRDYWIVNPRPGNVAPRTVGPPARTVEEMMAFVSAGRGMAITSRSVADAHGSEGLCFVPIVDVEDAALVIAANANDSRPAITALLTELAGPG